MDEAELLRLLAALSSPQRLRVLARLTQGPGYVSQLARELAVGRPLLHMHLEKLESAGLVAGHLELSQDGKAKKFYALAPFSITLTADVISAALAASAVQPTLQDAHEDRGDPA